MAYKRPRRGAIRGAGDPVRSVKAPSSAEPAGLAGGDLSGNYPDPTVSGINGNPLGDTTPTLGNILVADGNQWVSVAPPKWYSIFYLTPTDFTPDITTSLTLPQAIPNDDEGKIRVTFDAAVQQSDCWGISGTTITFISAIPEGVQKIEIHYFV